MILMIDEEARRLSSVVGYLKEGGYIVKCIDNVDDGYVFFKKNVDGIEALVLDIMMPPGDLFDLRETKLGILTGKNFFEKIRRDFKKSLPTIFYTAMQDAHLLDVLAKEKNTVVLRKGSDSAHAIESTLRNYGISPSETIKNE